MVPCCALVCVILGLLGQIIFSVGFALPYWFSDPEAGGTSHGLWQKKECTAYGGCTETRIGFGVTAAFESCRVFSCATIAMAFIAFIFNLILVNKASRQWAIRSSAMWACTVVFNILAIVLFGATEKETLEELNLVGVDPSAEMLPRLNWCYWLVIGAAAIYLLLAISVGLVSCSAEVRPKKIYEESTPQHTIDDYRTNVHVVDNMSLVTNKTQEAFPVLPKSDATTTVFQPAVHSAPTSRYISHPSRAAVNIDHQRVRLNALDTPHYVLNPSTQMDKPDVKVVNKFVLNRPVFSPENPANSSVSGAEITIRKQGYGTQDGVYSINVSRNGLAVPRPSASTHDVNRVYSNAQNVEGPPAYTTLPRDERHNVSVVSIPSTSDQMATNSNSGLYPNLQ